MKNILFFVLLLCSTSLYASTPEEYLYAKGYSPEEISLIVKDGKINRRIQASIDQQYSLSMLGYSHEDIEKEVLRRYFKKVDEPKKRTQYVRSPPLGNIEREFLPIVTEASNTFSIHSDLIFAVIRTESGFNPKAVSRVGASGMMQLMPSTATFLGVSNSFDPYENVMGGTKYLRMLLNRFDEDLDLALAAYVAGPEAVEKSGRKVPNYPEVLKYIKDVKKFYKRYAS